MGLRVLVVLFVFNLFLINTNVDAFGLLRKLFRPHGGGGGGHGGVNVGNNECVCTATGDPHYRSFDGVKFDFMGTCKYILSETVDNGDCGFSIRAYNKKWGHTHTSVTDAIEVVFMNHVFVMGQGFRFMVDGKECRSRAVTEGTQVRVFMSGNMMTLFSEQCGILVEWNGNTNVHIKLDKGKYGGRVRGLCGNCNGNTGDDIGLRLDGGRALNVVDFANSFIIEGGQGGPQCEVRIRPTDNGENRKITVITPKQVDETEDRKVPPRKVIDVTVRPGKKLPAVRENEDAEEDATEKIKVTTTKERIPKPGRKPKPPVKVSVKEVDEEEAEQHPCQGDWERRVRHMKYCGSFLEVNGPFGQCIKEGKVNIDALYQACRFDVCSNKENAAAIHQIVCESIAAFDIECSNQGFEGIQWRKEVNCGQKCGENQVYSAKVNPCPASCDTLRDGKCTCCEALPTTEGCECKPGFVLLGTECVTKEKCPPSKEIKLSFKKLNRKLVEQTHTLDKAFDQSSSEEMTFGPNGEPLTVKKQNKNTGHHREDKKNKEENENRVEVNVDGNGDFMKDAGDFMKTFNF